MENQKPVIFLVNATAIDAVFEQLRVALPASHQAFINEFAKNARVVSEEEREALAEIELKAKENKKQSEDSE